MVPGAIQARFFLEMEQDVVQEIDEEAEDFATEELQELSQDNAVHEDDNGKSATSKTDYVGTRQWPKRYKDLSGSRTMTDLGL